MSFQSEARFVREMDSDGEYEQRGARPMGRRGVPAKPAADIAAGERSDTVSDIDPNTVYHPRELTAWEERRAAVNARRGAEGREPLPPPLYTVEELVRIQADPDFKARIAEVAERTCGRAAAPPRPPQPEPAEEVAGVGQLLAQQLDLGSGSSDEGPRFGIDDSVSQRGSIAPANRRLAHGRQPAAPAQGRAHRQQGMPPAGKQRGGPAPNRPWAYASLVHPARFADAMPRCREPLTVEQQNAFLDQIADIEIRNAELQPDEAQVREALRFRLEQITRYVFRGLEHAARNEDFDPTALRLQPIGSMNDELAMRAADLDLLVIAPNSTVMQNVLRTDVARTLTMAIQEDDMGANEFRSRTGEISVRGCQEPTREVAQKMLARITVDENEGKSEQRVADEQLAKKWRLAGAEGWLHGEDLEIAQDFCMAVDRDFPEDKLAPRREALDLLPNILGRYRDRGGNRVELPSPEHVGVRFNISFRNHLGVFNAKLLKCYALCDDRLRQMAIFVRAWARKRDICSTSQGTLSHYGFLLLVLHYCINIADPPVVPNLQRQLQADRGGAPGNPVECDGYDVRFWRDEAAIIQARNERRLTYNTESLGSLLRGFFHYYSGYPNFHCSPYHWRDEAVCVRVEGGIERKKTLGWIAAQTKLIPLAHDPKGEPAVVKDYFHLAVQDPFEIDRNIGRHVNREGLEAIRDEFKRAHKIIESGGDVRGHNSSLFFEVCHKELEKNKSYFGKPPARDAPDAAPGAPSNAGRGGRGGAGPAGAPRGGPVGLSGALPGNQGGGTLGSGGRGGFGGRPGPGGRGGGGPAGFGGRGRPGGARGGFGGGRGQEGGFGGRGGGQGGGRGGGRGFGRGF